MISIVISTYNRPEKLKRAVQSVFDQTFKDWELIIVHDGPEPEWPDILEGIDVNKIRLLRLEENSGSDTKPKNEGIKDARGEYICLLDDDNEYLPDHLMVLWQEHLRNPEIDVIYGDRLVVDEKGEMEPQIGIASDFDGALLVTHNFIDTSDVLIKKDALYKVGGFDERYKKYVDWNLWVRMSKAGCSFKHVAKVITHYYLHEDMKSLKVLDGAPVGTKPLELLNPQRVFKPQWDFFELEIVLPYLGNTWKPKIAFFTLTMNRLDYTQRMYESLQKASYPFDWYIVDNGSTDGTVEWLQSLKLTEIVTPHLILNEENKGISIASNQALDAMGDQYDFIGKIDNDCELLNDQWLSKMLHILEAHWMIVLSPYVEGLVDNPGGVARQAYKKLRGHMLGVVPHLGGIFNLTHKSSFKDFRWGDKDFLHGMQDSIFSAEMRKRQIVMAYIEDMRCLHQRTTTGQKEDYPLYFKQREYEKTHRYEGKDLQIHSRAQTQDSPREDGEQEPNVEEQTESKPTQGTSERLGTASNARNEVTGQQKDER